MKKTNASVEIVEVKPEKASEWLSDRWGEQRKVRTAHVARLLADMRADRFRLSSDAILIVKGKLANGQHRMEALVEFGKPLKFLVMETNDEDIYKILDCGIKRGVNDGLAHVPFAKEIAAVARWAISYNSRTARPSNRGGAEGQYHGTNGQNVKALFTQVAVIDFCIENQDKLLDAVKKVNLFYAKTKLLNLSIGGAIMFIATENGLGSKAEEFLEYVYVNGGSGTSAIDLRNRLISDKGSKAKLAKGYVFGISLKAFKSFCNGTRSGCLKLVDGEPFPTL